MLESGEGVIPKDKLTRWERQMNTRYADLPEDEKESDRHQADKVIATVLAHSEEAPGG